MTIEMMESSWISSTERSKLRDRRQVTMGMNQGRTRCCGRPGSVALSDHDPLCQGVPDPALGLVHGDPGKPCGPAAGRPPRQSNLLTHPENTRRCRRTHRPRKPEGALPTHRDSRAGLCPRILAARLVLCLALTMSMSKVMAADLKVLSASPSGAQEESPRRIQILFDAPVVPLAAPDLGDNPPDWLRIDPPILAHWRWAGTDTLVGEPASKLPGATAYTITIEPGLRSIDLNQLRERFTVAFTTPFPQVTITTEAPEWAHDPFEWASSWRGQSGVSRIPDIGSEAPLLLIWSQPVDDASVAEHVRVRLSPHAVPNAERILPPSEVERFRRDDPTAYANWKTFLEQARGPARMKATYDLEPDPKYPHRVYRIRPRESWPRSSFVEVEVLEGARSLEGPVPSPAAPKASFTTFQALAPLRFSGRSPESGTEGSGGFDPESVSLVFSAPVRWQDLASHLRYRRIPDGSPKPGAEKKREPEPERKAGTPSGSGKGASSTGWKTIEPQEDVWYWTYENTLLDLSPLGLEAGAGYEICIGRDEHGSQSSGLGFPWCGTLRTAHRPPRFNLVQGDGVIERNGPHQLPLGSTNVLSYAVKHRSLDEEEIVPVLRDADQRTARLQGGSTEIALTASSPDVRMVTPVELDEVLRGAPGIVLTEVQALKVLPSSEYDDEERRALREPRSAITQVTRFGLTVKSSRHEGILVWVTDLQESHPVDGAVVRVRDKANRILWEGKTDREGLVWTPPDIGAGEDDRYSPDGDSSSSSETIRRAWLVTARVGDDMAYAKTHWSEGHRAWEFNLPVDWHEERPITGLVWADRGLARPGESIHVKAVLRRRENRGLRLLDRRDVTFVVRDARGQDALVRTAALDAWGAAEAEVPIPPSAPLGSWSVMVGDVYDEKIRRFNARDQWDAAGEFRVAEFRRPKFRVTVAMDANRLIAGDGFGAVVEGSFLAGGVMTGAPAQWTVTAEKDSWRPESSRWEGFEFLPYGFGEEEDDELQRRETTLTVAKGEGVLDARGALRVSLDRVEAVKKWPSRLEVEAEVRDVERQTSAARGSALVLPGEFLIGIQRPPYFLEARQGVDSSIVALDPDGTAIAGVTVKVRLVRRHWESIRRRSASGRYEFESRPVDEDVTATDVVTGHDPVPVHLDAKDGGYYALVASAADRRGNSLETDTTFYVFGEGFSPWRLDRDNRIDLIAERDRYAPGDTARVLVKSPWTAALALITVERAGVLETRVATLTGTMPVIEIPIRPEHAPNIFVSVVLIRGRVPAAADPDMADPGRPTYRIGYCQLSIPPRERTLSVVVKPDAPEFRPSRTAAAHVHVDGADGAARRASVTVWAVDAGVLHLSGYRTPDPIASFYEPQGLGITTSESRTRLVGRRSYGAKGARHGGGGGFLAGSEQVRRDFRALAFWKGDLVTGSDGNARFAFSLPDSLTTYRLIAVAVGGPEEFGSDDAEFLVTKPVGLEPALPRFVRPGDRAQAGVVVRNRTKEPRRIEVRATAAIGAPVRLDGESRRSVVVRAGGSVDVRFGLTGLRPGTAKIRFDAKAVTTTVAHDSNAAAAASGAAVPSGGASSPSSSRIVSSATESDALEVPLPVVPVAPTETVATFFATLDRAEQAIAVPSDVFPYSGGLDVRLAPTSIVEATQGVHFLESYPHRCSEQISSRLIGIVAASRLGVSLAPKDVDGQPVAAWIQGSVDRLAKYQRTGGGFGFWIEGGDENEVLTAHVLWALALAKEAGAVVDPRMTDGAAEFLSKALRESRWLWGERDGWSVKVLASFALERSGRAEPSYFQSLFDTRRGRAVWAKALLAVTMLHVNGSDPRAASLRDEVRGSLSVEARTARLLEPSPPWGWWVWWSERRGSAIALMALGMDGRSGGPSLDPIADRLERGLLDHLARDTFPTTQDTAWMLAALAGSASSSGREEGRREAAASLGGKPLLHAVFESRASPAVSASLSMDALMKRGGRGSETGTTIPLVVTVQGGKIVHAAASLSYARRRPESATLAEGMTLERTFVSTRDRGSEPGNGGTASRDAKSTKAARALSGIEAGEEVILEVGVSSTGPGRFVAIDVPLPAGLEVLDPDLATTRRARPSAPSDSRDDSGQNDEERRAEEWDNWWEASGFDHVEMRDDRIVIYATYLSPGTHRTSVRCRATTPGTFALAPAHAEHMYEPEIFSTTGAGSFEVFAPKP